MKILITGANGQLGLTLKDVFDGSDLTLTDKDELDITDAEAVNNFVEVKKPDVLINAAAYTAVDQAEVDKELAKKINVDGVANLAAAAKKFDVLFFHVSTDFVFEGKKSVPYTETDEPKPLSVYGETKFGSEVAIEKIGGRYFVLRSAWLYSPYGKNFVKTIAKLGREKEELKVVSDQIGCPTYTYDLALAMKELIDKAKGLQPDDDLFGLYNYAGNGQCSWFEFAQEIIKLSDGNAKVLPQTSYEYTASRDGITADRPKYSALNCDKIKKLGIKTQPWRESLSKCIEILKQNKEL